MSPYILGGRGSIDEVLGSGAYSHQTGSAVNPLATMKTLTNFNPMDTCRE